MGSKNQISDETKERIKALLATGKAKQAVARELGVSWATVDKYSKQKPDKLEDLREQKRQEFIAEAWEDIRAAMHLGRQKIKLATVTIESFQETIDRLIELLEDNPETNGKDVIELIKALSSVTNIPLSHISTYFGTLYDKQALAKGDPTNNTSMTITLDGELDEWAG